MSLSSEQYKDKIILEVGDNADGLLAATVDLLWDAHDNQAELEVRYLYAKRDAIDVMLGSVRAQVDFTIDNDHSRKQSQKAQILLAMRAACQATLDQALALAAAASGGTVGQLTTTAPVAPLTGQQNPSDRRYRGDPLRPPRWRWRP